MEPKLIKTDIAEYTPGIFDGENKSGIDPVGDKVLILTDQVPEQVRGVFFTEDQRERQCLAAETGIIVDMGGEAFDLNYSRTRKWGESRKPQIGDHVYIERYSGVVFRGDDGQRYRLMDYTSIGAVRKEPLQAISETAND